jgi:gingipain R
VLLVGDHGQVSSYTGCNSGMSDSSYAKVAGDDNYPDILIGRFSAETVNDVKTQVDRTINYERDMTTSSDFLATALGIGSNEGSAEKDKAHIEDIRTKLLKFTYTTVDQAYDPGATASQVASSLNNGKSLINYCGHGSQNAWTTSGFSSTNIKSLTNAWKLPFIISVACVNGQFHNGTCFAETWMRSTDSAGNPIGAMGTYMSTINQPWIPPMVAQDEAIDLLVNGINTTFGALCYNGSCKMLDNSGSSGLQTFDTWIVFGDPSATISTKAPSEMTVNHSGKISSNDKSYQVSVPGVANALCSLSVNGENLGATYTDSEGNASVILNKSLAVGTKLTLTVTAFNQVTNISDVVVGSGGGPTEEPTIAPTIAPTEDPTVAPTEAPTVAPTVVPTEAPTVAPTATPTLAPTVAPTATATPKPWWPWPWPW